MGPGGGTRTVMDDRQRDLIAQLESQLRESHPESEAVLATLPDDPTARVAALATVLQLDAAHAIRRDFPLERLVEDRNNRRRASKEVSQLFRDQGVPLPQEEVGK